jgi:hypothetical protein
LSAPTSPAVAIIGIGNAVGFKMLKDKTAWPGHLEAAAQELAAVANEDLHLSGCVHSLHSTKLDARREIDR